MTATCVPPCVEMMVQAPPFLWLPSDRLLLGGVPHTSSCQRPGPRPPTEASEATSEAAGLPVHETGSGCSGHSVSWGTRNGPSLTYTTTRVSPGCVILEPGEVGLGPSVLRARNTLEGHGFWLMGPGPGSAARTSVLLSCKGSSQLPPCELSEPQPGAVSSELLPLV